MPKKVTYDPLWKTLKVRQMKKGDLQRAAQLSRGTITKMGKDESVTIDVISKIATALDISDISQILEIEDMEESR